MRPPCIDCTRKHIAQAIVLLDESKNGYPPHKWLAIGHLAEAESEARGLNLGIEKKIRQARIAIQEGEDPDLLRFIVRLTDAQNAGEIKNEFVPDYKYWDEDERGMQRGTIKEGHSEVAEVVDDE